MTMARTNFFSIYIFLKIIQVKNSYFTTFHTIHIATCCNSVSTTCNLVDHLNTSSFLSHSNILNDHTCFIPLWLYVSTVSSHVHLRGYPRNSQLHTRNNTQRTIGKFILQIFPFCLTIQKLTRVFSRRD